MEIQRLASGDEALFRAMNRLFGEEFGDQESYGAAPPSDAYVKRLLAENCFVALVAVAGDQVIGALAAYELMKFEQQRSELYIYDLAVAAGHRRRGIATALIGWLQEYARQVGAWTIFVQADPPDAPALALYETLGTREEVLHFDIPPA